MCSPIILQHNWIFLNLPYQEGQRIYGVMSWHDKRESRYIVLAVLTKQDRCHISYVRHFVMFSPEGTHFLVHAECDIVFFLWRLLKILI